MILKDSSLSSISCTLSPCKLMLGTQAFPVQDGGVILQKKLRWLAGKNHHEWVDSKTSIFPCYPVILGWQSSWTPCQTDRSRIGGLHRPQCLWHVLLWQQMHECRVPVHSKAPMPRQRGVRVAAFEKQQVQLGVSPPFQEWCLQLLATPEGRSAEAFRKLAWGLHAGPWGVGCVLLFHSPGTSIDVWYNGCTSFCGDTCIPGPYSTVFAQGLEYIPWSYLRYGLFCMSSGWFVGCVPLLTHHVCIALWLGVRKSRPHGTAQSIHPQRAKNPVILGEQFGCNLDPGMMYFPTKWGAKQPQNPQNPRVEYIKSMVFVEEIFTEVEFYLLTWQLATPPTFLFHHIMKLLLRGVILWNFPSSIRRSFVQNPTYPP